MRKLFKILGGILLIVVALNVVSSCSSQETEKIKNPVKNSTEENGYVKYVVYAQITDRKPTVFYQFSVRPEQITEKDGKVIYSIDNSHKVVVSKTGVVFTHDGVEEVFRGNAGVAVYGRFSSL